MRRTFCDCIFFCLPLAFFLSMAPPADAGIFGRCHVQTVPARCFYPGPAISLFDGETLDGWTTLGGGPISDGWEVVDGTIHRKGSGGYLVVDQDFTHFILDFEWKISEGGNSGLKYKVKKFEKGGWLGCEYQILDDANHPNGNKVKTSAAALYDVYAPAEHKVLKPVGEYNHSRIRVYGNTIEHWLNGMKVLHVRTDSKDWQEHIAESKFAGKEGFGKNLVGKIMLQDHGDEVWYRNITVRHLTPASQMKKSRSFGRSAGGVFRNLFRRCR